MTKTEVFSFSPSAAVRNCDLNQFIGKEIEISLGHISESKDNQYIYSEALQYGNNPEDKMIISGWCGKYFGERESKVIWEIKDMYFIVHNNGGRTPRIDKPRTYNEFYNDWQKEKYDIWQGGGVMGKVFNSLKGDFDRADILIKFKNHVTIESFAWEFKMPEEWYSDMYKEINTLCFADGFYESSEKAIEIFSKKSSTDLFGERYFPVLVFPKDTPQKVIDEAQYMPKSSSNIILKDDQIVFGTRCKPYEFQNVIEFCYENGGKVPVGVQWDWE